MEYSKKTFRNLFEQWVEDFEGKPHMYKLVSSSHVDEDGIADCKGCCFGSSNRLCQHCCNYAPTPEASCPVEQGKNGIVKDLGILRNGKLPSSFGVYPSTQYPEAGEPWVIYAWICRDKMIIKEEKAYGRTEQEAIDNWNRRY